MRYMSGMETKKIMGAHLAETIPGGKFKLRTNRGVMYVNILSGATWREVYDETRMFEGEGFDSSIDLAFAYTHYLLDGKVVGYRTAGSVSSMGYTEAHRDEMPEGAEEVTFPRHVFVSGGRD